MEDASWVFLDTLCLYCEEEIEVDAYFAAPALAFDDAEHFGKFVLLAAVERFAAAAIAPLIARCGLTTRSTDDLISSGRIEAQCTPLYWTRLMAEMAETNSGYLKSFRRLEAMQP